jgi:hypothetical protein
MRPTLIPPALDGRPFLSAEARALGLSPKSLQGSRFRRLAKGVYVTATTADSYWVHVRGIMLTLPPGTIATGVTGLHLLGVDIGSQLPMTFATTHPPQIRRRDIKVMRLRELPAHRDGIASPEHCWLIAASTLNLLDLVTAGDSLLRLRRTKLARLHSSVVGYSGRGIVAARAALKLVRERVTRRGRPGSDCAWFSRGYRCPSAISSSVTTTAHWPGRPRVSRIQVDHRV